MGTWGRPASLSWNPIVVGTLIGYGLAALGLVIALVVAAEPGWSDAEHYRALGVGLLLGLFAAHALGVTIWYVIFHGRAQWTTATVLSCQFAGYAGRRSNRKLYNVEMGYSLPVVGSRTPRWQTVTFRRQFERRDRGDRIEVLVDPGPAAVWLPTPLLWPQIVNVNDGRKVTP